ncbi:MAG TPA: adenosine deaminase [Candidatus Dormibacteraeota bacterium]|nr:adenosine deaminase [Candidatus Dormibacteraeota bacterium]
MALDDAAYFLAIPKAELHLHLDGSVRPRTVLELAKQEGVPLPTDDLDKLRSFLEANDSTSSLVEYIEFFELPIAVLQTVPALERATYELCEDAAKENVRYIEIRYGPWLHVQRGLSLTDVIRAVLSGWTRGRQEFDLEGGIIATALRDMPPAQNISLAQVAGRFIDQGLVGFDLAGDEAGHPPILHEDAFRVARSVGLNITIHAGEAAGPESVRQAISMGARRLGHGVRAQEDPDVVAMIKENDVQLDMAPTSNAQTKAVRRLEDHPLRRYYEQDIKTTISTDSRTVSDITLTHEYETAVRAIGCTRDEVWAMNLLALDGGFGDQASRRRLRQEFISAEASLRRSRTG